VFLVCKREKEKKKYREKKELRRSPFFLGPGVRLVFFSHTPSEKEKEKKRKRKKEKKRKKRKK
jgi:hypothetical protein